MYKCRDILTQGQCPSLGIITLTPNTWNPWIPFRTSASNHLLFSIKQSYKTCAQGQLRVHKGDNAGGPVDRTGHEVLLQAKLDVHRRVPGHRGRQHRDRQQHRDRFIRNETRFIKITRFTKIARLTRITGITRINKITRITSITICTTITRNHQIEMPNVQYLLRSSFHVFPEYCLFLKLKCSDMI